MNYLIEQRIIKIKFEYKCFPVWIYGEDNHLIENDLPEYLIGDSEINLLFERLQEKYDALFIDDGSKFEFKGFLDIKEEKEFYDEVIYGARKLEEKLKIGDLLDCSSIKI